MSGGEEGEQAEVPGPGRALGTPPGWPPLGVPCNDTVSPPPRTVASWAHSSSGPGFLPVETQRYQSGFVMGDQVPKQCPSPPPSQGKVLLCFTLVSLSPALTVTSCLRPAPPG